MTATPEQVVAAAALVNAYAQAQEQTEDQAAAVAASLWATFDGWYSPDATRSIAIEMAQLSEAGQDIAAGIAQQYVQTIAQIATGTQGVFPTTPKAPEIRNGVPMVLVHTRPSEAYKRMVATGTEPQDARIKAAVRATGQLRSDMTLAERATAQAELERLGVTRYRRVIHPELSETGTCGLCFAASDRTYSVGELMPIHPPHCKCTVMPVVGSWDPGLNLNQADLEDLYQRAGQSLPDGRRVDRTTYGRYLQNVKYRVNEHGEFGPVLTKAGDNFRGPKEVALENDPARARRLLEKALPVLERMEDEGRPDEVLAYQREFVARMQAIAA